MGSTFAKLPVIVIPSAPNPSPQDSLSGRDASTRTSSLRDLVLPQHDNSTSRISLIPQMASRQVDKHVFQTGLPRRQMLERPALSIDRIQ